MDEFGWGSISFMPEYLAITFLFLAAVMIYLHDSMIFFISSLGLIISHNLTGLSLLLMIVGFRCSSSLQILPSQFSLLSTVSNNFFDFDVSFYTLKD